MSHKPSSSYIAENCQHFDNCDVQACPYNHTNRRNCRDGLGCVKAGCWFNHMEKPEMKSELMCMYGAECWSKSTSKCLRNHPGTNDCFKGEKCFSLSCQYNHPSLMCKYRKNCNRQNDTSNACQYRHPPATDEETDSTDTSKHSRGEKRTSKPKSTRENHLSYSLPLTKKGLQVFISKFESHGKKKGYTDLDLKMFLPKAMKEPVAQNWYVDNKVLLEDKSVDWKTFRDKFLSECLTEAQSTYGAWNNIFRAKQQPGERASAFLEKIRLEFGDKYSSFGEGSLITWMIGQLNSDVRQHVDSKGRPNSYTALLEVIRQYEESAAENNSCTATEHSVDQFEQSQPSESSFIPHDSINQKAVENVNDSTIQHIRNHPRCYHCSELGHIRSTCPNRPTKSVNYYVNLFESL